MNATSAMTSSTRLPRWPGGVPAAVIAALLTALLTACGGGGGGSPAPAPAPPAPAPVAPMAATPVSPPAGTDIALLFMGNSHTSVNNVPAMVEAMVRAANPGKTVAAVLAPTSLFLEERSMDEANLLSVRGSAWSAVFLQAQKYSSSGQVSYPTTGAEKLVRESRAVGALPIMFPEWSRLGFDETVQIYNLHVSIAQREPACVAPVGQAWDLSLQRYPSLVLHNPDGNHSAPAGAFLAALVLAATYTQASPAQVPYLPDFPVDATTQERLRGVAAETVAAYPPRALCK
jgi:hypothetical protein